LIDTLAEANVHEALVGCAARTVYLPWLDDAVRRFRAAWEAAGSCHLPAGGSWRGEVKAALL